MPFRKKKDPYEPPNHYVIDRTTPEFINRMMCIIHGYYSYNPEDGLVVRIGNNKQICEYSHQIIMEYAKRNDDFCPKPNKFFGRDDLFLMLKDSKNEDFFELLDCMLWYLYPGNDSNDCDFSQEKYYRMTEEMNEAMIEHGIGYQIAEGTLTIQTEETVFEEITNPCLNCLVINDLFDADRFMMEAFEAYRHNLFEESVNNAAKAIENVVYNIAKRRGIDADVRKKFSETVKKLLEDKDLPNQISEHHDSLAKIIQTGMSVRNDRTAHGREIKEVNGALARYVIYTVCVDILFLVRIFLEEE